MDVEMARLFTKSAVRKMLTRITRVWAGAMQS